MLVAAWIIAFFPPSKVVFDLTRWNFLRSLRAECPRNLAVLWRLQWMASSYPWPWDIIWPVRICHTSRPYAFFWLTAFQLVKLVAPDADSDLMAELPMWLLLLRLWIIHDAATTPKTATAIVREDTAEERAWSAWSCQVVCWFVAVVSFGLLAAHLGAFRSPITPWKVLGMLTGKLFCTVLAPLRQRLWSLWSSCFSTSCRKAVWACHQLEKSTLAWRFADAAICRACWQTKNKAVEEWGRSSVAKLSSSQAGLVRS